jgi:hypothetical protein
MRKVADALGVAVDADVLAHDVRGGFNGGGDGHGGGVISFVREVARREASQR